jgi:hypothetical protein
VSLKRNYGDLFGDNKYILVSLKLMLREGTLNRELGLYSLVIVPFDGFLFLSKMFVRLV